MKLMCDAYFNVGFDEMVAEGLLGPPQEDGSDA